MAQLNYGGKLMLKIKHTDDHYYDVIRKNIRKYRKEKGYTQAKLANECDLSLDFISEIESLKRRKSFSIATLTRISDTLDISIEKFFEEEN